MTIFGTTTVGGTIDTAPGARYKFGNVYTAPISGPIVAIWVYTVSGGAAGKFVPIIHNATSPTAPTTVLDYGPETTVAAGQAAGWVRVPCTQGASVVAGQLYHIGVEMPFTTNGSGTTNPASSVEFYNDASGGTNVYIQDTGNTYPVPQSPWSSGQLGGTVATTGYSFYAEILDSAAPIRGTRPSLFGPNASLIVPFQLLGSQTDATVVGLTSAWTVDVPVGSVTSAPTVTGLTAAWTVAAPAGSVAASVAVTGLTATWTVAAPTGTVTSAPSVTGLTAAWTVAAPTGGTIVVSVPGGTAAWTITAPVGVVSGAATITGLTAAWTVAAPVGAVAGGIIVTGATTAWTVAAPAGTVTGVAAVAGATAHWTVAAPAGTVTAVATIIGLTSTWTVAAPVGTVAAPVVLTGATARWTVTAVNPGLVRVEQFVTPTVAYQSAQWKADALWRYRTINQGVSVVLYLDGTHTEMQYPPDGLFTDPTVLKVFRGGYRYYVSAAESAALHAAGYTTQFVLIKP